MKAFVTGATGLLANNLVRALREAGHQLRALVRSGARGRQLLGDTGAELVRGDMEDAAAFAGALAGCDVVFHIGIKPDGSPGDEDTPPAATASGRLVRDFLAGALPAIPPGGTSAVDARPRRRISYPVAWRYAALAQTWARITGGETLVTVAAVRMMNARLRVSSAKAERELGWRHRPLSESLRDEVAWYRAHDSALEPAA